MQFEEIFNKGADLRTLAQRLVEAAAGKDEQLVIKYAREAHDITEAVVTEVELELPRFAVDLPDVMDPDGREQAARQMLDNLHDLTVKFKIVESIFRRMEVRLGLTHEMTATARQRRDEVYSEREAAIWTILELMGVDS